MKTKLPARIRLDSGFEVQKPTNATDAEPKWNKLFPLGTFHRSDFPEAGITFDAAFLSKMVENWKAAGSKPKPINFFHFGASDVLAPIEDKVASGWMEDLQVRADGLWALVRWTDDARALILADKLRYLSPEFSTNATDRSTGKRHGPELFGAGLLNDPFLEELPRVAASASTTQADEADEGATMDKAQICALLGLSADASDEVVMAALAKAAKKEEAVDGEAEKKLTVLSASVTNLTDTLKASNAENVKLAARLEKLETEKKALEVDTLIADLKKEGRIVAAQGDQVKAFAKAAGFEEAKKFFSALPAVVRMGEQGITGEAGADVDTTSKDVVAYYAEVDKLIQGELKLSFQEATGRVNRSHPKLHAAVNAVIASKSPKSRPTEADEDIN